MSTKLGNQVSDPNYSLGKSLTDNHLVKLASKVSSPNAVTVVLTANDVAVTTGASYNAHGTNGRKVLGTLAGMGGVIPTAEGVQRRTIPWEGDEQEEGDKEKNAIFISGTEAGKISEEIQNVEKRRIIILDVPTVGGPLMFVDMAGSENIEQAGTYLLTKNMYSAYDGSTVLPSPYISSEFSFL
ncbi:kinesin-like protein KIN-10A [Tanacetum coccineum]